MSKVLFLNNELEQKYRSNSFKSLLYDYLLEIEVETIFVDTRILEMVEDVLAGFDIILNNRIFQFKTNESKLKAVENILAVWAELKTWPHENAKINKVDIVERSDMY